MVEIVLSNTPDYHKLYDFVLNKKIKQEVIRINLESHRLIQPIQVMMLVLFIIHHLNTGCEITIVEPKNKNVAKYLHDISFYSFLSTNYAFSMTLNSIESHTAMPFKRINKTTLEQYINHTISYLKGMCPFRNLDMLNVCIAELINNVYDHAESPIDAYIFCQLYPRQNEIRIIVGDLGLGIPVTVNKYLKRENRGILPASATIKWAFRENKSTKSQPHNLGKGLFNLLNFSKNNNGQITVLSNEVEYNFTGRSYVQENSINFFKGTIVETVIKVDNLPFLDAAEMVNELW